MKTKPNVAYCGRICDGNRFEHVYGQENIKTGFVEELVIDTPHSVEFKKVIYIRNICMSCGETWYVELKDK